MNVLLVLIKQMHFLASNLSSARCSPVGSFFANKDQKSVGSMSTLLGVCQHWHSAEFAKREHKLTKKLL